LSDLGELLEKVRVASTGPVDCGLEVLSELIDDNEYWNPLCK
jgi:hypothetical protein